MEAQLLNKEDYIKYAEENCLTYYIMDNGKFYYKEFVHVSSSIPGLVYYDEEGNLVSEYYWDEDPEITQKKADRIKYFN